MTIPEAKKICDAFLLKTGQYTEEEAFIFSEAAHFIIRETHDAAYMHNLAVAYEWQEHYDLAYKYYKMAAENAVSTRISGSEISGITAEQVRLTMKRLFDITQNLTMTYTLNTR